MKIPYFLLLIVFCSAAQADTFHSVVERIKGDACDIIALDGRYNCKNLVYIDLQLQDKNAESNYIPHAKVKFALLSSERLEEIDLSKIKNETAKRLLELRSLSQGFEKPMNYTYEAIDVYLYFDAAKDSPIKITTYETSFSLRDSEGSKSGNPR
ncbi:hypothetical protein [Microbulbifer taiwanensis]|uniref:DUF4426 domain-containing protein n=1 Tax=Microbulbifer taiwanensis TaxID=986746 RepID=A0ABW1YQH7_9GAMM|nr:hypothetical protein [Microbulbifer taiwanensis]